MRKLAERLGVGTMSLYRYVPGKAELLDLMVDRVCGDVDRAPYVGGWRARLEGVAHANLQMYRRHPWLIGVFPGRPPMGPGVLSKYEHELGSIEGIGLTDVEMDLALSVVLGYVRGAALTVIEAAGITQQTGRDDHEWWAAMAPTLEQVFNADRYPLATRVGTAATSD